MISPKSRSIISAFVSTVFPSLYGGEEVLNHVRMLDAHLVVACVCVYVRTLDCWVGSDPGCVTSLAQNCHSSRVLLQATLRPHANASH